MDIFMIISLAGGLALFLYGMSMLGSGLEKLSGGRMERTLEKLTKNVFMSVLLGALVTAAIQSSSATTVIVVGLVNAGILKLKPAVGVIMGANIGTTVTAQILRLGDLDSNQNVNIFMKFLKPTTLAPLVAIVGIIFFMVSKRTKYKDIGQMLIGFGILFTGMQAMEAAVRPLGTAVPIFKQPYSGSIGRCRRHCVNSKFFRFYWYSSGIKFYRRHHFFFGIPHYYGTKYRNLYYPYPIQYRCKQKCETCRFRSLVF